MSDTTYTLQIVCTTRNSCVPAFCNHCAPIPSEQASPMSAFAAGQNRLHKAQGLRTMTKVASTLGNMCKHSRQIINGTVTVLHGCVYTALSLSPPSSRCSKSQLPLGASIKTAQDNLLRCASENRHLNGRSIITYSL